MKRRIYWLLLGLLAWFAAAAPSLWAAGPKPTVIYLVRHAEKDLSSTVPDPPLSAAGLVRAQDLRSKLAGKHPAALFTTNTLRTRATLGPLAQATGLTPLVYNSLQPDDFAIQLYKEYAGRTVVVVGHSNTLLPLLAALGVKAPMQEIKEDEFKYLFKVELREGQPAKLKVSQYGAK